jgi:hypothetical protein
MDSIHLAQDRNQWRALVSTVMLVSSAQLAASLEDSVP